MFFQNRSVLLSVKLVLVTLTRCPTGEILISSVLYHMQFPCEDFAVPIGNHRLGRLKALLLFHWVFAAANTLVYQAKTLYHSPHGSTPR